MKNKVMKRALVIVLALALITSMMLSGATAKYTASFSAGIAEIDIAKWDISIENTSTVNVNDKTLTVTPTIDRGAIYAENFENGMATTSSAIRDELGWTYPSSGDPYFDTGSHTRKPLSLAYADDPYNANNKVIKLDPGLDEGHARKRSIIMTQKQMEKIDKFSISFDALICATSSGQATSTVLDICFGGESKPNSSSKYMRLDIRPCNSSSKPDISQAATNVGITVIKNDGGQGATYELIDGVTPGQTWFNVRMDVDYTTGKVTVYCNNEKYIDYTIDDNNYKIRGPLVLWSQFGVSYIDNLTVYKSSDIYAEDFNDTENYADLEWTNASSTGDYSLSDGALTANGAATNRAKFKTLSGKDKYSVSFDFNLPKPENSAGSTVLGIVFNTEKTTIGTNDSEYMRMDIRPEKTNGVYNVIGVRIVRGSKGGSVGTYKLDSNTFFNGDVLGAWHSCRMDVDNVTKVIKLYINNKLAYEYKYDASTPDETVTVNGKTETIPDEWNEEGGMRVHRSRDFEVHSTNNLLLWTQIGKSSIDNLVVNESFDGVEQSNVAPGTGGKIAEVNITNNSDVATQFILVLEAKKNSSNDAVLPKNFKLFEGGNTTGKATVATVGAGGRTITFTGELDIPNTENGINTAKCEVGWLWEYISRSGDGSDSNSIDTTDGENTETINDIDVTIKEFSVVQIDPGSSEVTPLTSKLTTRHMSIEKNTFSINEPLIVTAVGSNHRDWVGVYRADAEIKTASNCLSYSFIALTTDNIPHNARNHTWETTSVIDLSDDRCNYQGTFSSNPQPGEYKIVWGASDGYNITECLYITLTE